LILSSFSLHHHHPSSHFHPPPPPPSSPQQAITPYLTLTNWLYTVTSLRLLSVVLGYTYPASIAGNNLETQLFDKANAKSPENNKKEGLIKNPQFTPLAARTFGIWTATTCVVCIVTTLDIKNRSMLLLCHATFLLAIGYFTAELFIYRTVSLTTVRRQFIVAIISAAWTLFELVK
jgi:hypothetical protein